MSEREAFLRCILENPEDDTVRLVFADWLDENGEREYGAHVRTAVGYGNSYTAHNKTSPTHRYYPWPPTDLEWNVSDTMPDYCENATESRGLIYSVELNCEAFLENAEDLFRRFPITKVWLRDCEPVAYEMNGVRYYRWWKLRNKLPRRDSWILPDVLWNELPHRYARYIREHHHEYESHEEARLALHEACVRYGRRLAKLPPLPTLTPAS